MSLLALMIHDNCNHGSQHICIPGKMTEEKIHKRKARTTAKCLTRKTSGNWYRIIPLIFYLYPIGQNEILHGHPLVSREPEKYFLYSGILWVSKNIQYPINMEEGKNRNWAAISRLHHSKHISIFVAIINTYYFAYIIFHIPFLVFI